MTKSSKDLTILKEGDYVISDLPSIEHFFKDGPRQILKIRKVNGPEGDAVMLFGCPCEFWSMYLYRLNMESFIKL